MVIDSPRRLRADAARNVERIVRTARTVFADHGPDAPLEEVAQRARVDIRTLYRHFPHKADLVRAALEQGIAEQITPALDRALADENPLHGLVTVFEAAMRMAAREHNTLSAARTAGLTDAVSGPFYESLTLLTGRAQQAGLVRADLVPSDMPRLLAMLVTVLWTMDPTDDGWRRYVALLFDALSPESATPLPPAVPPRVADPRRWPL